MSNLLVNVLESFLGEHRKHNESTGQISFDCPACAIDSGKPDGDGKGNLEINYNKGVFQCWACQEVNNMHGPVIKLLRKYGSPKIIRDYVLLKPDTEFVTIKEKEKITVTLPEEFKKLSECTIKDYKYQSAINYLRDRGITDDIISEFNIGYAYRGKYYNRIIFPSYDIDGNLNYFVGRWFSKQKPDSKYLNPDAEKDSIIFNEAKLNFDSTIYLVEGPTDHIVTPNSTTLLGKYLTPKLLDALQEKATGFVVIVLDDDAWNDAVRLYQELNFGNLYGRVKIVKCPTGYDPSLIYQTLGKKGIVKLLKTARFLTPNEII